MSEFTGARYITCGIRNEVPLELQIILWDMIDTDKRQGNVLDYLQIFSLKPVYKNGAVMQEITHKQEQPFRIKKMMVVTDNPITAKIYAIDDVTHITMLLSDEY